MNTTTVRAAGAAAMRTIAKLESGEMDAATGLAIGMNVHGALRAEEDVLKAMLAGSGDAPGAVKLAA